MNKEYYKKLIIVDFDDTLCIHGSDGDISSGSPNFQLINRLNELYDNGYKIEIRTARGHFSAKSRKDAEHKYKHIIVEWLQKHNVKYNKLSFQKPYALCYIDDKAVRPYEIHLLEGL